MDDLARRYLDLWQQNISAAAGDADMARSLAQFFGQFNAANWPMPGSGERGPGEQGAGGEEDKIDIGAMLASIDRRLAAIEMRLDKIEAPPAKSKPRTRKKS